MHSLEVGGLERVVLELARRARAEGLDHSLLVCDRPFEPGGRDFDPGEVPCAFLRRGPGLDLGFVHGLRRLLRASDAEIVHAHNDTPIGYAALAGIPRRIGVPALVGTFHTLPSHGGSAARRLTRWATRRAAAVTTVSDELGGRLRSSGWCGASRTIPNGVDLELFRPPASEAQRTAARRKWGLAPGRFVVGCLARFVPGKRQEDLLAAGARLLERGVPVTLVFAGQGPLFEPFREQARTRPEVVVLEPVADVPALLAGFDAFVLCSDHEAHPRALLEALACGVPAVVSATGTMPDLVGTGEHAGGFVVPARDPAALADALSGLALDRALRERAGRAARQRASEHSFEAQWLRYRELWSGVIRRNADG